MTKLLLTVALLTSINVMAEITSVGRIENRLSDGKTKTEDISVINLFYVGTDQNGQQVELPVTKLNHGGRIVTVKKFLGQKNKAYDFMNGDAYLVFLSCFHQNKENNSIRVITNSETTEYTLTRRKGWDHYLVKRYQVPTEFRSVVCLR